jgi:hypothetical protein
MTDEETAGAVLARAATDWARDALRGYASEQPAAAEALAGLVMGGAVQLQVSVLVNGREHSISLLALGDRTTAIASQTVRAASPAALN